MDWSQMFTSRVVVFGCGNTLIGDDAVGPLVIQKLEQDPDMPQDVGLIDAGTSVRNLLFDLMLADKHPQRVVVVDATTAENRQPGEIWEIDVSDVTPEKAKLFTLHMFPTVNLLANLQQNTSIDLKILVMQTGFVPDYMSEALSPEVEAALPGLVERVKQLCLESASSR